MHSFHIYIKHYDGTNKEHFSRHVSTTEDAVNEFYKLLDMRHFYSGRLYVTYNGKAVLDRKVTALSRAIIARPTKKKLQKEFQDFKNCEDKNCEDKNCEDKNCEDKNCEDRDEF